MQDTLDCIQPHRSYRLVMFATLVTLQVIAQLFPIATKVMAQSNLSHFPLSQNAVGISQGLSSLTNEDTGQDSIESNPSVAVKRRLPGTSEHVDLIGRWPYGPSKAMAVDHERSLAFVGSGAGVIVFDMTDPSSPTELSRWASPDIVKGLFFARNHIYVAANALGLRVLELSNPMAPKEIGVLPSSKPVTGVAVAGDFAYTLEGTTLHVVDITVPSNPRPHGSCSIGSVLYSITAIGDTVYLGVEKGIRIVSVTNPAFPSILGVHEFPGGLSYDLCLQGPYLYVAGLEDGLRIVDVSQSDAPKDLGSLLQGTRVEGVYASGSLAYLALPGGSSTGNQCLTIVDVNNPATPQVIGSYVGYNKNRVAVVGTVAYLSGSKFEAVDVSNPGAPSGLSTIDLPGRTGKIYTLNNHLYTLEETGHVFGRTYGGIRIFDVTNETAPNPIGYFTALTTVYDFSIREPYIYMAASNGLFVIDISTPETPTQVAKYNFSGFHIAQAGPLMSLETMYGIQVIDVSDPLAIKKLGFYSTSAPVWYSTASDTRAYIMEDASGKNLKIVDLTNPMQPIEIGAYASPYSVSHVNVSGDFAYLSQFTNGFQILDIADPTIPLPVGSFSNDPDCHVSSVSGDLAFLGDYLLGLRILDISDPGAPAELGFYQTAGYVDDVVASGDYAYLACGEEGINILGYNPAPTTGSLAASVEPEGAIAAGGGWSVDAGPWRSSGETVTGLSVGEHTITFKDVLGWTSPSSQTLSIVANQTTSLTGTYTLVPKTGSLTVTISPQGAIDGGAQWRVDGGTWQNSGTSLSNLTAGQHVIDFKNITGWTTSSSQRVTITAGQDLQATGAYADQFVADFSAAPANGKAPLKVTFTDQSVGIVSSWHWDFGDGKTSTKQSPSYTYKRPGSYTVTLTVTGSNGTRTATAVINAYATPKANFTATPKKGTRPLAVSFTDKSKGSITSWAWEFGDGSASAEQNPSHNFAEVGTFTVKLNATGPIGSSTKTQKITVKEP
jgi:PKD repeat protein